MHFKSEQNEIAKRLTLGATVYQNYFLRDIIFRDQFKDNYKALVCFIQNYAYERQGAAAAYPIIAEMVIEKLFQGKMRLVTISHAKEAWKICKQIARKEFNDLELNESHNPMNSDKGVLTVMATEQISNISLHTKDLIERDKTREAHNLIKSIRGIGPKIASFYLRDIAYLGNLSESKIKDQYYLQPIDTWLEQSLSIIFADKVPTELTKKQKIIVELCEEANCSPIAFNQGAWVLGSQIAGDFNTFRKIAKGNNARAIIKKHISTKKEYIHQVEKIVDKFAGVL